MRAVQRILIEKKTGKTFLVKDLNEDFNSPYGVIAKEDLTKSSAKSSKGKEFALCEPSFMDLFQNLRKGPQTIKAKDIGLILAKTGVNGECTVVDAGGGAGALTVALANVCKHVVTYEINPEHYDIVAKNIALCGMKNVTLKQENVYDGIAEKEVDLITLDLPEPWKVVEHAEKALRQGGFIVVYLPNMTQVKSFIDATKRTSISVLETIEVLERKWKIEERVMRPEHEMLGHTAFLVFCRKV